MVYDQSFKKTLVELLNSGKSVKDLTKEFGVSQASIHRWDKEFNTTTSQDNSQSEMLKIKALEKELKDVKLERDIFKKGGKHLFQERQVIYRFIKLNTGLFPVEKMCKCMRVSKNSYYTWLRVGQYKGQKSSVSHLKSRVIAIFNDSKQIYGSLRIQKSLEREGIVYSRSYIALIMKSLGLRSVLSKKFRVCTTDSNHTFALADNMLNRNFKSTKLGEKWVSDITYIKVGGQWNYLTTILDLADRKIVSWVLTENMDTENTVYKAWLQARKNRDITNNHIFHSDRGVQYASNKMTSVLNSSKKITQSMSRKGNCWDNAVAESLFKTIKYECTNRYVFNYYLDAYKVIEQYIKWYNCKRLHSALDYKSPMEMEAELIMKNNKNVA
ncbi:IS3 family transposase [Oceanihabitans sp. IOP_32]|nr:IS3 family transposase [Oceanihabitans sp. IOP_32]QFZ56053.1 IS3 family transposase [Oceanihabitans sp. IOP_32]QFZ56054.1 IS3 family transposase [Oceanihabitans sp. IOP_32]QFZ56056.1 IS3 family transposase [Oceanihabitans sp. IOP_32]QFZ56058.1 IS3 family transposase [Oceanihabitans sp. IOP_32]QFZ56079.1 IS3 family transposase [Oceanihabitans sp. IOP_32]